MNKLGLSHSALVCFVLAITSSLLADNRILLTLVAPPRAATDALLAQDLEQQTEAIAKKIEAMSGQPLSTIALKNLKYSIKASIHPKVSGFTALYAGYSDISNSDGTISLPLRHTAPKLYLAVTPDFTLVKVKDQTFSHAEYKPGVPVALYQCERIKDKNMAIWDIKEIPIPADNRINPLAVILLTKPSNLYIPTGKHLAIESAHLVLPDIYVVGTIDNEDVLLQALDQKIYFESLQSTVQNPTPVILQTLVPNL